jgi:tRNA C32,U32 (ribose-2'-O)-methylase TrmJ
MSVTAFKLNHVESIADKMKRLRDEAAGHARVHAQDFIRAIEVVETLAEEIAGGGEAYPVGIRQAAKHIGPTLSGTRLNVTSLLGRDV